MTKVSVNAPKTPVTEGSSGIAAATLPNVCKMPGPPAPFVPTPLPNIGKSGTDPKGYSKTVTIEGEKIAIRGASFGSMGDVASKGTGGGIISSNVEGPTIFAGPGSMNVKIEGKNVQLLGDPMLNNCGPSGSPANAATMLGVVQKTGAVIFVTGDDRCPLCRKRHGEDGALKETPATKVHAGRLAQRIARKVHRKELPSTLSTMLGVVQCKCEKEIYADQSGVTYEGFCQSVRELGWRAPTAGSAFIRHQVNGKTEEKSRVLQFLETRLPRHSARVEKTWAVAENFASMSKVGATSSAYYRPGFCAAPKALMLLMTDRALPANITERWFHSRKRKVGGKIKFFDAESGEELEEQFDHGDTVPPCGSCNLILPLMLCTEDKGQQCQHTTAAT